MIRYPFRLAIFDMDDTLLGPDKKISRANVEALQDLRAAGVEVVIASGRHHNNITIFEEALGFQGWIISAGGAVVRHSTTQEVIFNLTVPQALGVELFERGRALGATTIGYHDSGIFCDRESTWTHLYTRRTWQVPIADIPALIDAGLQKMIWTMEAPRITELTPNLQAEYRDRLYVVSTEHEMIEFLNPQANKALAAQVLAHRLKLAPEQILAMGDGNNDVPLLEWAGFSVAMAHGREAAKNAAKRISPPGAAETAVARALAELAANPDTSGTSGRAGGARMTEPGLSTLYCYPWYPDRGDGTYRNPILHADYSDPDVIRHGADFWMVASSFGATPGLPILHSSDLVNWRLVNYAIKKVPGDRYAQVQPGCGVWAPSLRFHAGKFWIFFPLPDEGIYVTNADRPDGEWSEPWLLQAALGWIDPCPFWDDDGQAYLAYAYANSRAGKKDRIHIRPMSPDGRSLLGEGQEVIHAPHHPYLEGPKLDKINGWYYLMAPGGGVPTGWQVAFRARSVYGPYEEKIVLETGSTKINGPHQGALVDTPNGAWWFIHFQDAGPFGRITHLQPVTWKDEWPCPGIDYDGNGVGEPVLSYRKPEIAGSSERLTLAVGDEFQGPNLALAWQWSANHHDEWYSLAVRPGHLRLFAQEQSPSARVLPPNVLLQKFPARVFSVETEIEYCPEVEGESAGLVVTGGPGSATLFLQQIAGRAQLAFLISDQELAIELESSPNRCAVRLRVDIDAQAVCRFAYALSDADFTFIETTFTPKEGGWMGAKVGLFCLRPLESSMGGYADFTYFRFASPPPV